MTSAPLRFAYTSMGTSWEITIWDEVDQTVFSALRKDIMAQSQKFDETYSRFKSTSLISELSKKNGIFEVPRDLIQMLEIYKKLNVLSGGILNPLVGFALSDIGYDATYSLEPKDIIRAVPDFNDTVSIIDDTHIELHAPALIDLGALGKGFFVDKIATYLRRQGLSRFLVNGSGDIYYSGAGTPLRAGLEHPADPTKVIGIIEIDDGALCASASNRRKWDKYHHTLNPKTLTSPEEIIATWIRADSAAMADGLCTCLFMTKPEQYAELDFEYCLLNPSYAIKRSAGFQAELF